jgi:hypothetical protein
MLELNFRGLLGNTHWRFRVKFSNILTEDFRGFTQWYSAGLRAG